MTGTLAVTWWGHSTTTVELGTTRVATDPLFTRMLYGLRRRIATPPDDAAVADVVLVSHIHYDHLHVPSLTRFPRGTPIVVPRGAPPRARGLGRLEVVEVEPGDIVDVAGVRVEVLPAHHDGRRSLLHRGQAPALGFRFAAEGHTVWYPGDTGLRPEVVDVEPVDLAMVPIGGWGPSLGDEHLEPYEAAEAVDAVGARWALAVHYSTYWPVGLRHLRPGKHRHYFLSPAERYRAAMHERGLPAEPLTPAFGERVQLVSDVVS